MVGGGMGKKSIASKTRLLRSRSTANAAPISNSVDQVTTDEEDYAPDSCDESEQPDIGSPDISSQERMGLHKPESHRCIKCNKVGKMLVCTEVGCPVAIHEDCLSSKAKFDDSRNFYCPYCSYKRAVAKVQELRKKAISAKRKLSKFLKVANVDASEKEHVVNENQHDDDEISVENDDVVHDQANQHIDENGENLAAANGKCDLGVDTDLEVRDNEEAHQGSNLEEIAVEKEHEKIRSPKNIKKRKKMERTGKEDEELAKEDALEFNSGENVENEGHEAHSESLSEGSQDDGGSSKPSTRLREKQILVKKVTNVNPPEARRKRLTWTAEEEQMLKDGVQIFSNTKKKNLPWRKILDFGSHIFHRTRTPADIQNKWKNITRKN